MRTRLLSVVTFLWAGPFVAACGGEGEGYRVLRVGEAAPAYGARTLAGDSVVLADLYDRPVIVNLWATWCVPCREEMPELQELHERFRDRIRVIGVTIDGAGATDHIRSFVEEVGIDFPILHDPQQRIVRRFTTVGVPETFLIDEDGIVRHRWIGRYAPLSDDNLGILSIVLDRASPDGRLP